MFVRELGQDLPFAVEARAQASVSETRTQQFQRSAAFEQSVGAFGQPDLAHSALADQPQQPVRANQRTGQRNADRGVIDRRAEKIRTRRIQREQPADLGSDVRRFLLQPQQAQFTRIRLQLQQFVE